MSAAPEQTLGWSTSNAAGAPFADSERYRLRWRPSNSRRTKKTAVFEIGPNREFAVLRYIRAIRVAQRMRERYEKFDSNPDLDDIPEGWRANMRANGLVPVGTSAVAPRSRNTPTAETKGGA